MGGREHIMQTYQWRQSSPKEIEMTEMWEETWLLPACGWQCTEGKDTDVADENRWQYKWAGALNGASVNCTYCSTLGTMLLWLCLACLKMWYFCSAAAPSLSYSSNIGRKQEESKICLCSGANLLCNPCPSPWAFAPQALLESVMMGKSYLSLQGSAHRR